MKGSSFKNLARAGMVLTAGAAMVAGPASAALAADGSGSAAARGAAPCPPMMGGPMMGGPMMGGPMPGSPVPDGSTPFVPWMTCDAGNPGDGGLAGLVIIIFHGNGGWPMMPGGSQSTGAGGPAGDGGRPPATGPMLAAPGTGPTLAVAPGA